MAGGIDWFRWHHGSVTDPKFGLVAKKAGASTAEVIAVWASLLEAASISEDRGDPGLPDFEAIDFALGMADGKARRIYEHMRSRELIDAETGRIAAWEKRQPKRERESDSSTGRVQAFRERQRQPEPSNASETPRNASDATETPRVEESREEEKKEQCTHTPLAREWALPKSWGLWAIAEFPHWTPEVVRTISEQFADHWKASGGASADWQATWQKWCRDDLTQRANPKPREPTKPKGPEPPTQGAALAALAGAELERQAGHAARLQDPEEQARIAAAREKARERVARVA